jgi:hypothetical protein
MTKEQMGLVDFKEQLIFEKEKDKGLGSSELFLKKVKHYYKYQITQSAFSNLYRKLVNYQVEKYGHTVYGFDNNFGLHTKYEQEVMRRRLYQKHRRRTK